MSISDNNIFKIKKVKNKNKNWRKEGIKDEDLVYVDDFGY